MRRAIMLIAVAGLVAAGCNHGEGIVPAREIVATRGVLTAVMVKKGPPIDGTLKSPIWQHCPPLVLGEVMSEEIGELKTTARVLFDAKNLYVAWECLEADTGSMKAEAVLRDDDAWNDDSVELFISGDPRVGVFHFAVNSKGVLQDWKVDPYGDNDLSWDSSAVAKASVEPSKRWIVTLSVPLKELGAYVGENQTWPMNLNRTKPAGEQQWTESSWSSEGRSSYNDSSGWGKIVGVTIRRRADGVTRTAEPPSE